MMDGLIVWAALGPILAFVAGAVVVACLNDDENEDLPDDLRRADGTTSAPSFDRYGYYRSAASPLPGPGTGCPVGRPARSCLQCGRSEE